MFMKNFICTFLLLTVLIPFSYAGEMKYVNNPYLIRKNLMNEKLQMALTALSADGSYSITNSYLSGLNGNVSVNTASKGVEFTLIPAAKICYVDNGIGMIRNNYVGVDGTVYEAPGENWNKFAFFAQRDTVQLYFLLVEAENPETNRIEKKYLTSVENGKLNFQPAIAGNGISALSQMFAIQGNLNVDVFQPPYDGIFIFAPIVSYSGGTTPINTAVGSENLKNGPVINVTASNVNDSLFVFSRNNNRNTCEFALIKSNKAVRVASVALNQKSVTLVNDDDSHREIMLTTTVLPENASNRKVRWVSNNEDIAVVSENGEVSAKYTGTTYIKAITMDGGISDSCLVTVKTTAGLIIQENSIVTDLSGSMDFSFEKPADDIYSATFNIELPDGYRLTENGVKLADELVPYFSIKIELTGNNEWKIALQPVLSGTTVRNAVLYQKLLDINYTVDAGIENGAYEIIVKDVRIQNENEVYIREEQLIVPTNVLRNTTGNRPIDEAEITVFYTNGRLVINSRHTEKIQIYSLTGALLYAGQVAGTASIPANYFSRIFIVKSSSGWTRKIIKD
jgi:hypothetical protein